MTETPRFTPIELSLRAGWLRPGRQELGSFLVLSGLMLAFLPGARGWTALGLGLALELLGLVLLLVRRERTRALVPLSGAPLQRTRLVVILAILIGGVLAVRFGFSTFSLDRHAFVALCGLVAMAAYLLGWLLSRQPGGSLRLDPGTLQLALGQRVPVLVSAGEVCGLWSNERLLVVARQRGRPIRIYANQLPVPIAEATSALEAWFAASGLAFAQPQPASFAKIAAISGVALGVLVGGIRFVVAGMGPAGSDRAAVAAHDQAVMLLRQDDEVSLAQADAQLAEVLTGHPKYLDAAADRALVLEFRGEALSHQIQALRERYEALEREVATCNAADWKAKANANLLQMKQIHGQYGELANQKAQLWREAFKLAEESLRAEPGNPATLRALAFYYGDQDDADKSARFVERYVKATGAPDGWSELALAELDASPPVSIEKRAEGLGHVREALARDSGLVRAHYLEVVMDVGLLDYAAAVVAATALAPTHESGRRLVADLAASLARAEAEKTAAAPGLLPAAGPSSTTGHTP